MTVTLEPKHITSQPTFDSYVEHYTELALHLVNELVVTVAGGQSVAPPADPSAQWAAINRALSAYDVANRYPRWSPLVPADVAPLVGALALLRRAADRAIDGNIQGSADILNALMIEHHAVPNLHGDNGNPPMLAFHAVDSDPVNARIADMSTMLAMVVGSWRISRLGRCQANECHRLFYDTTRNGSRRFCGLNCQNRAKASAFRARRA